MKLMGIIMAGGEGTRLRPLTSVVNKHILPIYNKPMIFYALAMMDLMGVDEVRVVIRPQDRSTYEELLAPYQISEKVTLVEQLVARGIPDGILLNRDIFEPDSRILFFLGDNIIFGGSLIENIKKTVASSKGCGIYLKKVRDPSRYGIASIDAESGQLEGIFEKPDNSLSNNAVIGLYIFDHTALERAEKLAPSARGELEIADILSSYLEDNDISYKFLGRGSFWFDTGTFDSLFQASEVVRVIETESGLAIGDLKIK